jgi:O-antigen/teichoic acid export membrane protein
VYVGLDYRYDSFLKISAFNALGNLGMSVILILGFFKDDRATGRIIGNALPVMVIAVVLIWYFWKKRRPKWNREQVTYAVTYSLPLIPHGISQVILSQFDRIMIKSMIGSAEAGIYSFGYNIFSIINVTANSLDNVWGPWFYEQMQQKKYEEIRRQSSKYAFGMLLFSVMVMLGTPELVMLLGAKAYWDAKYTVIPIVVGGFFMFLYTLPSSVEYYHEKTKYIAIGTACAAGVNILLNLWFISRFGYVAAAYTTLATYVLYFVFHYFIAARVQGFCIFDTKKMILYGISAVAAGALSLLLMEHGWIRWGLLLLCAAWTCLWLEKQFQITEKIRKRFWKK